jgi:hypothetical protein
VRLAVLTVVLLLAVPATAQDIIPNGGAAGGPALMLPHGDILNVRNIQGGIVEDPNLDIGAGSTEHPGDIALNFDVGRCVRIFDGRKHCWRGSARTHHVLRQAEGAWRPLRGLGLRRWQRGTSCAVARLLPGRKRVAATGVRSRQCPRSHVGLDSDASREHVPDRPAQSYQRAAGRSPLGQRRPFVKRTSGSVAVRLACTPPYAPSRRSTDYPQMDNRS